MRQRMLNMGLVPGIRLEVVRYAPLGDPIEIRIKRFLMSLRKEEARRVLVEAVGPCPGAETGIQGTFPWKILKASSLRSPEIRIPEKPRSSTALRGPIRRSGTSAA
ncbi:MAG: FeoA family protein [Candidatus Marinimicrobia bacterium]|nr:FeoA family protein [Candidatus Neomarinimicrobiota bacterium]